MYSIPFNINISISMLYHLAFQQHYNEAYDM